MNFKNCVKALVNINETKRLANAYVEDCKRLSLEELKTCITKVEGQYTSYENVARQLELLKTSDNTVIRIVVPILLKNLLDEDEFGMSCKSADESVFSYEQSIIDNSNNFDYKIMPKDFAMLKFLLDKSWEQGDISVDEKT